MPSNDFFSKNSLPSESRQERADYETLDAHPPTVVLIAGVIASGVALSLLVAGWFYQRQRRGFAGEVRQTSFRNGASQQTSIAMDWAALDRQNDLRLETYDWIDRPQGIVRVPIARAMDLLVAEASASSTTTQKTKAQP